MFGCLASHVAHHAALRGGADEPPLTELSDVKGLKQRLHQQHGLPPRFRQRLLHEGNALDDAVKLDSAMDLQVLIVSFSEVSEDQQYELIEAASDGRVAEAGGMVPDS